MPSKKATLRAQWNDAGEDVVVLHMFNRSRISPNPSPYPIKLETWLRMNDVKYVADFEEPMSKKKKCPWITVNGEDVADSQLAIEFLEEKLKKDMSASLSDTDRAIARSMRLMLEDHYYFCGALHRWKFGFDAKFLLEKYFAPFPMPGFLQKFFVKRVSKTISKQCHAQGIGRHTKEEVYRLGSADLKAISTFLGDKPYLMGDSPTVVDCTLFGFSANVFAALEAFGEEVDKDALVADWLSYDNLKAHFERIKEKYWPDWDDLKYKPEEKPEKKKKADEEKKKDDDKKDDEEKKDEEKKKDDEEKKDGEEEKKDDEKKDEEKKDEEKKE